MMIKPANIIWFTGLSGVGKTTLSKILKKELIRRKYKVLSIDGDIFRKKTKNIDTFTRENILKNNLKIIRYIKNLQHKFNFILVSVISPLSKSRALAKKKFKKKYFECYLKCSLKELKKRDTKGLYELARKNKIRNLIGYNSKIKYQKSRYKVIMIDTQRNNLKKCLEKILTNIL
tara:strand:+ start:196 stop:720 length:525 start_codon:yes stop_codon:yes gene_type:complete